LTRQGKPQLIANINACQAVADTIRTTLGPAGRDKLIATNRVTIRFVGENCQCDVYFPDTTISFSAFVLVVDA
jgi:hypothetical protein